jgi:hypothetical protein
VYCFTHEDKKNQLIIDVDNLEFKCLSTTRDLKLKFNSDTMYFNLPNDIHFGAVIYEMVK